MFTAIDERNGLVKVLWTDVRQRVTEIEPAFAAIIDELSPDQTYPLYLAYYPYGATDADTQSSLFPHINGGYYRITDPEVPKDIIKHLGYSANKTPLGIVLDKEIECYIDLKNDNITIPWLVYKPGDIFPLSTVLSKVNDRVYAPNGLLSSTAGVRSTFMLPNIGATTNHSNLQRDFNIKSRVPKSLYEHWQVFREIVNSKIINSDWRCCIMYFSEKWLISLHNDVKWKNLKQYLHELAWYRYEYERNRVYYDITFSIIQKTRNLKPNPYLADTAKHLFATALGAAPGYVPSIDNSALPLDVLQYVFIESYGLKKYIPTIMQPKHFNFERDCFPIYYSLQHPATHVFSPRSRQVTSTIYEMRELEHIMSIFIQELSKDNALSSDTIIGKIAKSVEFSYFHNTQDIHNVMQSSLEILNIDSRFNNSQFAKEQPGAIFAADASFLRGCVSIKTTKIPTKQEAKYANDCAAIP
ncbi:hypothetical protein OQJ26_02020 [Legionella sp. PATHC038]|uniref:hypothetical protein n=1 Tax=Legionella sheltonii TaxID=2992041 RepID=UPI002243041F|nr:hypothetical protein [Legionella sp. PATHC038]MCW8397565.1 hypothetical protein [Legionella sp. PATHC038]